MSYFSSRVGRPPSSAAKDKTASPKPVTSDSSLNGGYFGAGLGRAPNQPKPELAPSTTPSVGPCPLCGGKLVEDKRLWRCQDRCGTPWLLLDEGSHLLDLAALPFGICQCCDKAAALIKTDVGLLCPRSGEAHLLLPNGQSLRRKDVPNGLCLCCAPPQPLIWQDDHLCCPAKPANHYQRQGGKLKQLNTTKQPAAPADLLQAIDQALHQNTAKLTVNGLFDFD